MDYGIKISKPEVNVNIAKQNELIFNSSLPMLKIKDIGGGEIPYTHDGSAVDILVSRHKLGYKPVFRLLIQWYDIDTGVKKETYRNAPFTDTLVNGSVYFTANAYSDNDELRLSVSSYDGLGTESVILRYFYVVYYDQDEV